jgi:hypothetical protein
MDFSYWPLTKNNIHTMGTLKIKKNCEALLPFDLVIW